MTGVPTESTPRPPDGASDGAVSHRKETKSRHGIRFDRAAFAGSATPSSARSTVPSSTGPSLPAEKSFR